MLSPRYRLFAALIPLALAGCASAPPVAVAPPAPLAPAVPVEAQPAQLSALVSQVDIPFESFTLANGLTVLVHTDRKAPIVGVTTYYRVGSKHEPRGKTGFAHLYEHLFFGGSENVPNFDIPLESAGSTATNGSTSYDRTNYVETVPTGAVERALMMESDRMGHLLGAVTQDKLNKQRGVVQNEKRQGDNQPYGLADYAIGEGLFPVGHPYRHSTIGSMADLDAASLADVRQWFRDNYAPNNVVLALAGDIDVATARPLVEKWFGAIPRGKAVAPVAAAPVILPAPVRREMADQVPSTRLYRMWSGPGLNDPQAVALAVGMDILGGLASSRLDNALVRGSQVAVAVTASAQLSEQVSQLQAVMDVKPGVDRAAAEAEFGAVIDRLVREGPTADEVQRSATRLTSAQIAALEQVGGFYGKGATLAEGALYSNNPAKYREDLATMAALTPAKVQAALQQWLGRPAFTLAVVPGTRTESGDQMGGWGDEGQAAPPRAKRAAPVPAIRPGPKRSLPDIAPVGELAFPAVERVTLANGIKVSLARRTAVPKVLVSLNFDAGTSADRLDTPGTQAAMLALLDEGTATRDATAIAEAQERLGATISAQTGLDSSAVVLDALTANLAPSLALMADVVRNPRFAPEDVERVKGQRLAALAQAEASPQARAMRVMAPALFGPAHPYGLPADGLGTAASIAALSPEALRAAHARWLRPDLARITVVGDVTMDQLKPLLEQAFGAWVPPAGAAPVKPLDAAVPPAPPRVLLVDRPNSPQSFILGGKVLALTGRVPDQEPLELANEVLGAGFLSRLNLDLREDKGWSYGVYSQVTSPVGPRSLLVMAPVQSDRTGDALKLLLANMAALPGTRPVEPGELARVTDGNVRGLPNRFETNAAVLQAVIQNDRLGRPDDYQRSLPDRYRKVDAATLNAAARAWLQPQGMTFVVVGDRKLVEPQLQGLNLPLDVVSGE